MLRRELPHGYERQSKYDTIDRLQMPDKTAPPVRIPTLICILRSDTVIFTFPKTILISLLIPLRKKCKSERGAENSISPHTVYTACTDQSAGAVVVQINASLDIRRRPAPVQEGLGEVAAEEHVVRAPAPLPARGREVVGARRAAQGARSHPGEAAARTKDISSHRKASL